MGDIDEGRDAMGAQVTKRFSSFVLVWAGQLVSTLGSGMSSFGLVVWLFAETGAATPFALAALTGTLPAILFAPLAGSLADRRNRKAIVLVSDSLQAALTLCLLVIVSRGLLETWMVYVLTFASSTFQAFQEPAWTAAIPTIVPKDALGRANGLSSVSGSLASLLPPVMAGALYGTIGLGGLVAIDLASYAAALAGMLTTRIPRVPPSELGLKRPGILSEAVFGFRYMARVSGMLTLALYFACVNFALNFAFVLLGPMVMPFGGSVGYGAVQAVFGLGGVAGGIVAAVWGGPRTRRVPFTLAMFALSGLGVIVAGLRPSLWTVSAGLFAVMLGLQLGGAPLQMLFQTKIAPGAQGRTRSARSMVSMSLMPVAFLSAGPLADRVFGPALEAGGALSSSPLTAVVGVGAGRGEALIFVAGGALLLAATVVVSLSPKARRIESLPDLIDA